MVYRIQEGLQITEMTTLESKVRVTLYLQSDLLFHFDGKCVSFKYLVQGLLIVRMYITTMVQDHQYDLESKINIKYTYIQSLTASGLNFFFIFDGGCSCFTLMVCR